MTTAEDPHLAIGAYVLHALPPAERAAFENHLAGCDQCFREVAGLRETAALLGTRDTVPVTAQARAGTLRAVAGTRQDQVRRHPAARGRGVLRLALAASLAAAVTLGGIAVWQHGEADDARARAAWTGEWYETARDTFSEVLTAPDATLHTGELSDGTTASVVVSRSLARAVFTARDLPALTGDKVYELWYAAESGDVEPAGLLPGTAKLDARVLEGSPEDAVAVGITVEPAGGSPQPTGESLGVISLTAGA